MCVVLQVDARRSRAKTQSEKIDEGYKVNAYAMRVVRVFALTGLWYRCL